MKYLYNKLEMRHVFSGALMNALSLYMAFIIALGWLKKKKSVNNNVK